MTHMVRERSNILQGTLSLTKLTRCNGGGSKEGEKEVEKTRKKRIRKQRRRNRKQRKRMKRRRKRKRRGIGTREKLE